MRFCIVQSERYEVTFTRGAGHFRTSDIREVNETSARSELFKRGAPVLNDMRYVNFDVASAEIMAMRSVPPCVPATTSERRIAFIAGSELSYGMLRMLAAVREA